MRTDQNKYYRYLGWVAVLSNLILIAAVSMFHLGIFYSHSLFAFLFLLYIPCEYGSLFYLLEGMERVRKQRQEESLRQVQSLFEEDLQREIQAERAMLDEAHEKLQQELVAFARHPRSISYEQPAGALWSRDLYLNALFVHKAEQARRLGISFQADLKIDSLPEGSREMIISLFSNLIDNAFRASLKAGTPRVKLKASAFRGLLIIRLKNTLAPSQKVRLSHTDQKEPWKHGFGMKIIRKILESHDGTLIYEQKDGWFCQEVTVHMTPEPASFRLRPRICRGKVG